VAAAKGRGGERFPKGPKRTLAQVLLDLAQNPNLLDDDTRGDPDKFLAFLKHRYPQVPAQQLNLLTAGKLETIRIQVEAEFELNSPKARAYITYSITF